MKKVLVGVDKLEVVSQSSATLVTEVAASAGCRHIMHLCAWCKFCLLLPLLTSPVYSKITYVKSGMLQAIET